MKAANSGFTSAAKETANLDRSRKEIRPAAARSEALALPVSGS